MTKIDTTPIEEMHRNLCAEIAMLREVNRAQADNYASLARQLADREEQLRKAQERIRAADAERDHAWDMVAKADAAAIRCAAQSLDDKIRANAAKAREVRAWNEAIEAAADLAWRHHVWDMTSRGRNPDDYTGSYRTIAAAIRSLAKEAGE
jgi:hypothetical protein